MVGQADVESGQTLDLIDLGVEVPDVVVALVRLDAVLGRGEFLDEEVLGHEVELERDTAGKTEQ